MPCVTPETAFDQAGARLYYGVMCTIQKPKLLSGGNPQIPKGYGNEPVQASIEAMPGWKQDLGRKLDRLIEETYPGVQ